MNRICIFTGSRIGRKPEYAAAAKAMAAALVRRGLALVYGGGDVGLMGIIANEVLRLGGDVIGVIPRPLWSREVGHRGLADLRVVETMHERKATMAELSDGFIAMPGGLGTLEEIFEIWTWAQLGVHIKPCAFLDTGRYYERLFEFLDHATSEGFVSPELRGAAVVSDDPDRILDAFVAHVPLPVARWIAPAQT